MSGVVALPRSCTICARHDLGTIDELLVAGIGYRAIARQLDDAVTRDALTRHAENHLSASLVAAVADREDERGRTLLTQFEALLSDLRAVLEAAKADGKHTLTIAAVREMASLLERIGKLTGELRDSPSVVVNVATNPEWIRIASAIDDELRSFPEARERVAQRLTRLELAR